MGLFLLGHKYVTQFFEYYRIDSPDSILWDAVTKGLSFVKHTLLNELDASEHNYVVLYKDVLDSIAQVMEKQAPEGEKASYKDIQAYFEPDKRRGLNPKDLEKMLTKFTEKFMEVARPFITEIDLELQDPKDIAG